MKMIGQNIVVACLVGILLPANLYSATEARVDEIVSCIAERVRDTVKDERQYGYNQRVQITKFDSTGDAKSREEKLFRTIWINDKAFAHLVQKDGRNLTPVERAREISRQIDFSRKTPSKKSAVHDELKQISWHKLHSRFHFEIVQKLPSGGFLISFRPKHESLPAATRIERVLNHLTGKIWSDSACNVWRAEARLTQPVHFGLGLFAKIHEVSVKYSQQQIEDLWLPSELEVHFSANFALVRKERQRVFVHWFDPFLRQTAEARAQDAPSSSPR